MPGSGDTARINMVGGDRAVIDGTSSQSRSDAAFLWVGTDGDGELEITGTSGTFSLADTHVGRNGYDGTIIQSGGSVEVRFAPDDDGDLRVGAHGTGGDEQALYDLSGGSLYVRDFLDVGISDINSTFRISNDAELFSRRHIFISRGNNDGDMRFEVIGSDATITMDAGNSRIQFYEPGDNGSTTLYGAVDSGGISTIHSGGDVVFSANTELELDFVDGLVEGTWDFMTWEGDFTDEGLSLADGVNENIWSFDIDEVAKTLSITAIPEPSSLLLLSLAGLLLMKRRRV